ncbi:hypothetical protein E2C01_059465 [Portunus trituberculatus]|uniref:Uncharacterized protein n=1 Tax=Portunus trituberculatus TaxID=210409 RepID=A0A5B7H2M4_PORTR|nr:hypothetical protein [Portunus trituberculatus]
MPRALQLVRDPQHGRDCSSRPHPQRRVYTPPEKEEDEGKEKSRRRIRGRRGKKIQVLTLNLKLDPLANRGLDAIGGDTQVGSHVQSRHLANRQRLSLQHLHRCPRRHEEEKHYECSSIFKLVLKSYGSWNENLIALKNLERKGSDIASL